MPVEASNVMDWRALNPGITEAVKHTSVASSIHPFQNARRLKKAHEGTALLWRCALYDLQMRSSEHSELKRTNGQHGCLWTVGRNQSTRRKPVHVWGARQDADMQFNNTIYSQTHFFNFSLAGHKKASTGCGIWLQDIKKKNITHPSVPESHYVTIALEFQSSNELQKKNS